MPSESKNLPGVLLLVLSALGIFLCWLAAAAVVYSLFILQPSAASDAWNLSGASSGGLAFLTGLLQIPAFILSIQSLRGRSFFAKQPFLFKPASLAGLSWLFIMAAGIITSRIPVAGFVMVPLTIFAVAIPVWWLVEFSRRGLPRSTALREWGTLAIGLTVAPLLIMTFEVIAVVVIVIVVLVILSRYPGFFELLASIMQKLAIYQGRIDQLEEVIMELTRNPVIASAVFLMIGLIAPLFEEIIKPLVLWFLLKRSLEPYEGYDLGLISGGAFALLESASLVSRVGTESWVQAVVLRAAIGLLHIGLSGLVGYGLVSSWNRKRFGRALLFVIGAAGLHGAWNSLALLSGFISTNLPASSATEFQLTSGLVLSFLGMALVFAIVLYIVLRINLQLRRSFACTSNDVSLSPQPLSLP